MKRKVGIAKAHLIERSQATSRADLVEGFAASLQKVGVRLVSRIAKAGSRFEFLVAAPTDDKLMVRVSIGKKHATVQAIRGRKEGHEFTCPTYDDFRLYISNWGIKLPA